MREPLVGTFVLGSPALSGVVVEEVLAGAGGDAVGFVVAEVGGGDDDAHVGGGCWVVVNVVVVAGSW